MRQQSGHSEQFLHPVPTWSASISRKSQAAVLIPRTISEGFCCNPSPPESSQRNYSPDSDLMRGRRKSVLMDETASSNADGEFQSRIRSMRERFSEASEGDDNAGMSAAGLPQARPMGTQAGLFILDEEITLCPPPVPAQRSRNAISAMIESPGSTSGEQTADASPGESILAESLVAQSAMMELDTMSGITFPQPEAMSDPEPAAPDGAQICSLIGTHTAADSHVAAPRQHSPPWVDLEVLPLENPSPGRNNASGSIRLPRIMRRGSRPSRQEVPDCLDPLLPTPSAAQSKSALGGLGDCLSAVWQWLCKVGSGLMALGKKLRKQLLEALGMEQEEAQRLLAQGQAEEIRALLVPSQGHSLTHTQGRTLVAQPQRRPQRWRL